MRRIITVYDEIIQHGFKFLASFVCLLVSEHKWYSKDVFKGKKGMKFFNGKNTQQLKQPGGNGGREKNTKKQITMYFFVIFMAFLCRKLIFFP